MDHTAREPAWRDRRGARSDVVGREGAQSGMAGRRGARSGVMGCRGARSSAVGREGAAIRRDEPQDCMICKCQQRSEGDTSG